MKKADNSKNMLQRKKQKQIERQKWGKTIDSYNKSVHLTRKNIGLNSIRLFAAQSSIRRAGDFRVGTRLWEINSFSVITDTVSVALTPTVGVKQKISIKSIQALI